MPRNHALPSKVPDLEVPPHLLVKGPCPRIDRSLFVPGFPTFRHILFTTKLDNIGVKVFDSPAAKDRPTLIVCLKKSTFNNAAEYQQLLGQSVWVNYPHLQEAIVDVVMDRQTCLRANRINGNVEIVADTTEDAVFAKDAKTVHERCALWEELEMNFFKHEFCRYFGRLGIIVGEIDVVLKVRLLEGRTFAYSAHGKVTVEKKV
jgi:Exoribonuclease Xrn1 D1 domain